MLTDETHPSGPERRICAGDRAGCRLWQPAQARDPETRPATIAKLIVQINSTDTTSDDMVMLKDAKCGTEATVPCAARLKRDWGTDVPVVLTSGGSRLGFSDPASGANDVQSLAFTIPKGSTDWHPFTISGQAASAALGDAAIYGHDGSGKLIGEQGCTVFSFSPQACRLQARLRM
jgi:hypothetical protein